MGVVKQKFLPLFEHQIIRTPLFKILDPPLVYVSVALTKAFNCVLFPKGKPGLGMLIACEAPSSKRPRYTVSTPGVTLKFKKGRNVVAAQDRSRYAFVLRQASI